MHEPAGGHAHSRGTAQVAAKARLPSRHSTKPVVHLSAPYSVGLSPSVLIREDLRSHKVTCIRSLPAVFSWRDIQRAPHGHMLAPIQCPSIGFYRLSLPGSRTDSVHLL